MFNYIYIYMYIYLHTKQEKIEFIFGRFFRGLLNKKRRAAKPRILDLKKSFIFERVFKRILNKKRRAVQIKNPGFGGNVYF